MSGIYICDDVQAVRDLHADLLTPIARGFPILEQLDRQATRLVSGQSNRHHGAVVQLSNWHPEWVGSSAEEIFAADLTTADARLSMAREYGFDDWEHAVRIGQGSPETEFEHAVDALIAGEIDLLRELLDAHPALIDTRSRFGHRSTLLHYLAANGCETYRQCVPSNLLELCELLLTRGADVNASARMYGGSTALQLLATSAHPEAAGVAGPVVALLRQAGTR